MNKALIIFDLDGTLTDSCPGILKSIEYAIEKLGRTVPSREVLMTFVGPPLLAQFKEVFGMEDEEAEKAVSYFRERYNSVGVFENSVFDGIEYLLENLKNDGCSLSVATSKPVPMAKVVLEHFGIEKYFDYWQGSTGDKGRADKINIIEDVIQNCGFAGLKRRVFLVGDRKYDAQGASGCGIGFYGAGWGYAPGGELEGYPNDGIASSPENLYGMLYARLGMML